MNRDRSSASVSSAAAFYFTVHGGSSEPVTSTGFYRVSSMPSIPPVCEQSAPMNTSHRSFRAAHRSPSDSLPPVPPPTPQPSARMAPEDCGDDDARNRRVPATSPSVTQLKRRTVGDKGIGGLAFVPVTLGLCAFVWLVASGALANHAGAVGRELDGAREEAAEPAVVLHLEENSGPSSPLKAGAGETVVEIRTRTPTAMGRGRTATASGRAKASTRDDLEEEELPRASSKTRKTERPREIEDADAIGVHFTQDTEPTRGFQGFQTAEDRVGSEAVPTAHPDSPTTRAKHDHSWKGSHRSKRRHLYPRRHIHRTTPSK